MGNVVFEYRHSKAHVAEGFLLKFPCDFDGRGDAKTVELAIVGEAGRPWREHGFPATDVAVTIRARLRQLPLIIDLNECTHRQAVAAKPHAGRVSVDGFPLNLIPDEGVREPRALGKPAQGRALVDFRADGVRDGDRRDEFDEHVPPTGHKTITSFDPEEWCGANAGIPYEPRLGDGEVLLALDWKPS